MHALLTALTCGVLAGGMPQGDAPTCKDVGPELRQAIQDHVRTRHDTGVAMSEDQHELEWAGRQIREHGQEALPCLVDIFRRGLLQAGLWVYDRPAPEESKWVIELIRLVDPPTATKLYREWLTQEDDALTRVSIAIGLAALGEEELLPKVAAFLEQPPTVPDSDRQRLRLIEGRAIEVISFCNYRPGLRALRQLEAEPHASRWLPIYVAQLSGDHEAVFKYTSDPEVAPWALRSLRRMGREDLLRTLASNPKYKFRSLAETLLVGEPSI
jgi:hypothetical protein